MQDPTLYTWNKIARLYEERFMNLSIYYKSYDEFISLINLPVASVLDVGCGPGNITRYVQHRHPAWKFHGVDAVPNMIELFRKNVPECTTTVMDVRKIQDLKDVFDGIVAGFCIPYLNDADTVRLITAFRGLLKPDGGVYISFVEGDPDRSGLVTGSTGDQTYFYYHRLERIQEIMQSAGMQLFPVIQVMYARSADQQEMHTILIGKL